MNGLPELDLRIVGAVYGLGTISSLFGEKRASDPGFHIQRETREEALSLDRLGADIGDGS